MSDTFIGTLGNDIEGSNQGWKNLYGISGDDVLGSAQPGLSNIEGGAGNDYIYASWAAGVTYAHFYGGSGNDWIQGGATDTGEVPGDYIYGGAGDDVVEQNPNPDAPATSDFIEGGLGRDALYGGRGDDLMYGGDGDDSGADVTAGPSTENTTLPAGLFGGDGDDYLDGGDGNDLLVGGLGMDYQVGGRGNDIFDFNSADESPKGKALRDTIHDFKKGDKIDLSDIASGLDFIGKKAFHGEEGEIRLKKSTVQADFDGNGKADFEIRLDGVTKLKDGDFLL